MTSYIGNSPGLANRLIWQFTATASQTVFTGVDANNNNLNFVSYVIDVFVNGILVIKDSDYTTSNGNTITFAQGLSASDIVTIIGVGTFNLADTYTKSEIDTFNASLVPDSTTLTAGTGLTGGGDLSANLTFAVDVGTGANQIVQLDGSGALPAIDGSALTNLTANNLTGALPAIDGSALTSLTANNLTGALPAIDGSQLTGIPLPPEVFTPTNVSPTNAATDVVDPLTLIGSSYISPSGKTQKSSQWQISTVADFANTAYDSGEVVAVGVTHEVPLGNLTAPQLYYWRTRYRDTDDVFSEFSSATTFTTVDQLDGVALGDAACGGFYIGTICAASTCYYLIVAPNSTGCACCTWKTTRTTTSGTTSCVDGYNNTYGPMDNADHPAGNWTATRTINGFSDWYLPARDELNQLYVNDGGATNTNLPAGEGFAAVNYWSSTENSATGACCQNFGNGIQYNCYKTFINRVRAVRREPI
jgi:hypothetical protein